MIEIPLNGLLNLELVESVMTLVTEFVYLIMKFRILHNPEVMLEHYL
nr:MAG TPA: hypothetical protein [Bacteriophage sp.]